MSNMAYCRFQNTVKDLQDCENYLYDDGYESLSTDEQNACDRMARVCKAFLETYKDEVGEVEE